MEGRKRGMYGFNHKEENKPGQIALQWREKIWLENKKHPIDEFKSQKPFEFSIEIIEKQEAGRASESDDARLSDPHFLDFRIDYHA